MRRSKLPLVNNGNVFKEYSKAQRVCVHMLAEQLNADGGEDILLLKLEEYLANEDAADIFSLIRKLGRGDREKLGRMILNHPGIDLKIRKMIWGVLNI